MESPHDREAEIGVLGAVLHNNDALRHASEILQAEHFFSPGHRRIFQAMQEMFRAEIPIDEITLKHKLGDSGTSQIGGLPYIAELVDKTPVASNIAVYAAVVRDKWIARATIAELDSAKDSIIEKGTLNGQIDALRKRLEPIVGAGSGIHGTDAKTAIIAFSEWLDEKDHKPQAKTFTALDDYLHGIAPRKPTVIAARPGGGKTTLVAQSVIANAGAGIPTLFFSLEMDMLEIIGRAVSARTKIDGTKIIHRQQDDFQDSDWDKLVVATSELAELPFYIVAPDKALSVEQIESITRRYQDKHGVKFVVIDHLRKIATAKGPIYEQQTNRICDIASMAKVLDVPVLVAAQINRAGEDKPSLSHLEGSGAIEQESQAVVILHDENPHSNDARQLKGIIAKNRNGKTGVVDLRLTPWRYTIE